MNGSVLTRKGGSRKRRLLREKHREREGERGRRGGGKGNGKERERERIQQCSANSLVF